MAAVAAMVPTWTTSFGSGGLTAVASLAESTSAMIDRDSAPGRRVEAHCCV